MKTNFIIILIFILYFGSSDILLAQEFTIEQNFTGNNASNVRGQSFTPSSQGTGLGSPGTAKFVALKNIKVVYSSGEEASAIHLYKEIPPSIEALNQVTASNLLTSSSSKSTSGIYTVYHFDDIFIDVSKIYYALFNQDVNLEFAGGNQYAGGRMYQNNAQTLVFLSTADLKFIVTLDVLPLPDIQVTDLATGDVLIAGFFNEQNIVVGDSIKKTYRISNVGMSALKINYTLNGQGFMIGNTPPSSLSPNNFFDIDIYFKPSDDIRYVGDLTIETNDPYEPQFTFNLFGTATHYVYPPDDLFAIPYSKTEIKLSWPKSYFIDNFIIERSINGPSNFQTIAKLPADIGTFTDDSLDLSDTYFYRIKSEKDSRYSEYSNVASASPSAFARTGDWVEKKAFGDPRSFAETRRFNPVSFSTNEKGYIGLGAFPDNNFFLDFWEYDPISDSWTRKADFIGFARSNVSAFVINNLAYVGLGVGNSTPAMVNDFYKYNPSTDTWSTIAEYPGEARIDAVSFEINGKGYVGFGSDNTSNNTFNDMYEYDPSNNSWKQVASLSATVYSSQSIVLDGKAYLFAEDAVYMFDPAAGAIGTWTKKNPFPTNNPQASFVIGESAYVLFGSSLGHTYKYNKAIDSWSRMSDFPGHSNSGTASFSIGNYGYIGQGGGHGPGDEFWQFNPISPKPGNANVKYHSDQNLIALRWVDNSDSDHGYIIERGEPIYEYDYRSPSSFSQIAEIGANITSFNDEHISKNKLYEYRILAKYADGASAYQRVNTNTYEGLKAKIEVSASGSFEVSWKGMGSTFNYTLERAENQSLNIPSSFTTVVTNTSHYFYDDKNVASDKFYFYRVKGTFVKYGEVPFSDPAIIAIINEPTNCVVESDEPHKALIKWDDNSSIEESYIIESKLVSNSDYKIIATLPANSVSFIDINLKNEIYTYRVKAVASSFESQYSNEDQTNVITSIEPTVQEIELYPNPAHGKLYLKLKKGIRVNDVLMFTISGSVINTSIRNEHDSYVIDTSGLGNGLYYLKILTSTGLITQKVMIIESK